MCNHLQLSQPCECLLFFSYNANIMVLGLYWLGNLMDITYQRSGR